MASEYCQKTQNSDILEAYPNSNHFANEQTYYFNTRLVQYLDPHCYYLWFLQVSIQPAKFMNSGDEKSGHIIWKIGLGMIVPLKTDILSRFQRFVQNHSKNIQFLNGDTSWRLKLVPTIKKKSGFVMVSGFLLPFHSCPVFDHSKSGCVRFWYPFCKLVHTVYSD